MAHKYHLALIKNNISIYIIIISDQLWENQPPSHLVIRISRNTISKYSTNSNTLLAT